MRNLVNVLLKILGIVFLYWTIEKILGLVMYLEISSLNVSDINVNIQQLFRLLNFISLIINIVISALFSFFLLIKTDKVIRILKIKDKDTNLPDVQYSLLMRVGLKLVGFYVFATHLDNFFRTLVLKILGLNSDKAVKMLGSYTSLYNRYASIIEVIVELIPIVISLILIFATDKVMKILEDSSVNSKSKK